MREYLADFNAAVCGLAVVSLLAGCGGEEGSDSSAHDAGSSGDPYWTNYDATLAILPEAAAATKEHVWADWTTFTTGEQGSAEGTVPLMDAGVGLSYSGLLINAQVDGGRVYWLPDESYKSLIVNNAPTTGDILMLHGEDDSVHELTFSVPVVDPVIALMSVGSPEKTTVLRFDDPFDLLSFGPTPWLADGELKHLPDNVLSGRESSGVIRFPGTYSKIRFTTVISEPWFGLTVGLPSPQ